MPHREQEGSRRLPTSTRRQALQEGPNNPLRPTANKKIYRKTLLIEEFKERTAKYGLCHNPLWLGNRLN